MVIFDKDEDINKLYRIYCDILEMRVTIETIKRPKLIPQWCQEHEHTRKYCNEISRRAKCVKEHFTKYCNKLKRIVCKCGNYNEKHPDSYKGRQR